MNIKKEKVIIDNFFAALYDLAKELKKLKSTS